MSNQPICCGICFSSLKDIEYLPACLLPPKMFSFMRLRNVNIKWKKIVLWSNELSLQSNDEPRAPSARLFLLPLMRFRLEACKVFCTPLGILKSATSQNNTSEDKNSLAMLPLHEQGFSASSVLIQSSVSGWGCWGWVHQQRWNLSHISCTACFPDGGKTSLRLFDSTNGL